MPGYSPRWIIVAITLIVIGCADRKGPAEAAVMKVESSVAEIRDQASTSAPDDLKNVEVTLASLKSDLAKEDYKAVLANAPQLTSAIDSLKKTVAADVLAKIESAVAEIWDEAVRVAPHENVQFVETRLASLKNDLAKGNYQAVVANATYLASAVDDLEQTVAARKTEREAIIAAANAKGHDEWDSLSSEVARMVDAIQGRVDTLGKSRKLPNNVSQEDFDFAKSGFKDMKTLWAEATSDFALATSASTVAASEYGEIDAREALSKAKLVKQIGYTVMKKLRMEPL